MPKRQAKVVYEASKKSHFSLRSLVIQVFLGFFIALVILSFEKVASYPVNASQFSSPSAIAPLSTEFLHLSPFASSSPEFALPLTTQLEQSLSGKITSEAASLVPDYCVNMPVVMYHHIQPLAVAELLGHAPLTVDSTIFDEQIKYLKERGYHAMSSEELVDALHNRQPLPEKSVMITIDDGYDDNYTYAFLTAKKYQFVMNFMIPTGLIGTPGYMNWDHLKEMALNPYAKIYNHTTSHAPLGLIDKQQIIQEVTTANQQFSAELGLKNTILAYPYGSYTEEAITTVKELGITGAFTTDPGQDHCLSTILRLPRIRVGNAPISEYGF